MFAEITGSVTASTWEPAVAKLGGVTFWELHPFAVVEQLATGTAASANPELSEAYRDLRQAILKAASALNAQEWEWVVADYFTAQGADVDEREVGGNRPVVDVQASFSRGELGDDVWRIQVKRYQDKQVGWEAIEKDYRAAGDDIQFCFVSVFGFTPEALTKAEEEGIRLMDADDFAWFLASGKLRPDLRAKLRLPAVATD